MTAKDTNDAKALIVLQKRKGTADLIFLQKVTKGTKKEPLIFLTEDRQEREGGTADLIFLQKVTKRTKEEPLICANDSLILGGAAPFGG